MEIKLVFGFGAFLLCSSMVIANLEDNRGHKVGDCRKVSDEEAKQDKDLQAGIECIKAKLEENVNNAPGYHTQVELPDLEYCRKVVSGVQYDFVWTKEMYTTKCVNDPRSNRLCQKEKEITEDKNVNCKASLWMKPWLPEFKEFTGPECK